MVKNLVVLGALLLAGASPALATFSVDFPIVTRVQGATTIFYTAIDVTNNSSSATGVTFEYISGDLTIDATGAFVASLPAHANFHQDDLMQFLASQGAITTAQANSTFGTLLLTFTNPAFTTGLEASGTVRIYNFLNQGQRPSIGLAYRGVVLRLNGSHALSSVIQNTTGAPASIPAITTNMGLENVGVNDAGVVVLTPVTLTLSFTDGVTGNAVGPNPTITLQPGQVTQINDVWASYGLPQSSTNVVVSVQETSGTAQIRGYVVLKDVSTSDGSFFLMQ